MSLVWFEHVKRFWNMNPTRFIFGLMTRSKAITYDNLALRAPEFVDEVDHMVADETKAQGFDVDTKTPVPPMFQPFQLRGMTVPNRVVVSPMCQYSATDGLPNDWHLVHLGSRAIGGAGLVFTEMTDVSAEARISPGCTGLYNDEQEQAWKRIVDFVHANSGCENLHAARPCRPQGRDQAVLGRQRRAAGKRRLADRVGLAAPLLSRTARCRAK